MQRGSTWTGSDGFIARRYINYFSRFPWLASKGFDTIKLLLLANTLNLFLMRFARLRRQRRIAVYLPEGAK